MTGYGSEDSGPSSEHLPNPLCYWAPGLGDLGGAASCNCPLRAPRIGGKAQPCQGYSGGSDRRRP